MKKVMTTELYDKDSEGWYITIERKERDDSDGVFYTFKKESVDDGRSRTSFQVSEEQMDILMRLLKEMMG